MSKVYLVWASPKNYDGCSQLHSVCSSFSAAENKKKQIEQKIQNIKTQYYLEFESDYDKDEQYVCGDWIDDDEDISEEKSNTLMHQVYNYQHLYPELRIAEITIEERES